MKVNNPIFRKARVITSPFTWLVIVLSIGLNFGLSYLISSNLHGIGVMLYLDCIFTILVSCLYGYFPGLVVGMGTNLLNCIFDGDSIYYAFISGFIAIFAGLLMRTGSLRKWWGYLLGIAIFSFLGGGVGSIVTYFLYGQSVDVVTPSLTADLYNNLGFNAFWANLTGSFLWDLLDKTITMGIVLAVFLLYPKNEKPLEFFPNSFLLRTPWNEAPKRKFYQETSIHSLDFKIVAAMSVAYALLGTAVASVLGLAYQNTAFDEAGEHAKQYATAVTHVINGDDVKLWLAHADEIHENPSEYGYENAFISVESIMVSNEQVLDVYVFTTDGVTVLDVSYKDYLGKPLPHGDEYEEFTKNHPTDTYVTHNGEHGHFFSFYCPILDSEGETVAYSVANIDASMINIQVISNAVRILTVEAFVFLIGGAVLIHMIRYFFIVPLKIVDSEIRAYEAIGPKKWLTSKARKGLVKLRGQDEIASLSKISHSTMDLAAESILKIEEQAAKLIATQKGVVFALAEIIESRDKCTADHTTRTAMYSSMIAEELVKEGKYPDILTEEFIDNFAIAAALHDVGKIKIPDAILNKPAKLTKEEFDVMKEHTLEGEKIIELALKDIGASSNYLTTAKQVSGGHHERWDGTGYPRGLKGDETPLCARIVAIADVFDALTCRRPYKEPWPFEKAIATIQEESGTHFDPELVDAFMAIKDDVKAFLEKK